MSEIKGFREVVGPDGEISFEFASETEASTSSSDEEYVPPSVLGRRNAITNLDASSSGLWAEVIDIVDDHIPIASSSVEHPESLVSHIPVDLQNQNNQSLSRGGRDNFIVLPHIVTEEEAHSAIQQTTTVVHVNYNSQNSTLVSDWPEEFTELSIARTLVGQQLQNEENEEPEPLFEQEYEEIILDSSESNNSFLIDLPTPIPPRPTARITRRKKNPPRKRRKRKVVAKKKKVKPKIIRPPKPQPPVTIKRDVECRGKISDFKKKFRALKINLPHNNVDQPKAYQIGNLFLILCESLEEGIEAQTDFDCNAALEILQDLTSFDLSLAKDRNAASVILLKREVVVSDEEARLIPIPSASKAKYKHRKINYVNVEHYYFLCYIRDEANLALLDGLRSKRFRLDFVEFDTDQLCIRLNVMLLDSAILGEHDLNAVPYNTSSVKSLCGHFFKIENIQKVEQQQEKEDIDWFYGQILKYHKSETLPLPKFSLQHPSVNPILRDYQKDAVQWMLHKEGVLNNSESSNTESKVDIQELFLQKMYFQIELTDANQHTGELIKKPAFYNPYVGYVAWKRPNLREILKGGILADEMGLGKTVEVLSLILLNPRPSPVVIPSEITLKESSEYSDEESEYEETESESSNWNSSESDTKSYNNANCKKRSKTTKKKSRPEKRPKKTRGRQSKEHHLEKERQQSRLLRKRNVSPCEFEANNMDTDRVDMESTTDSVDHSSTIKCINGETAIAGPSNIATKKKRMIICSSDDETDDENLANHATDILVVKSKVIPKSSSVPPATTKSKPKRKIKRNAADKDEDEPKKVVKTYDRLKVIYENELSAYSLANIHQTKFHGEFFETTIKRRAFFECLCGDGISDLRQVVTCINCSASQHASCVIFDLKQRARSSYLCPHCEVAAPLLEAKTTLIVTPSTISYQWINEIQRHVKNHHMKILLYKGVNKHGYMPPYKLAEYDLIITSYSVLSTELNYVDLPHNNSDEGRKFRRAKRFMTIPSALTAVLWWRICLDEAQMVESSTSSTASMALRLQGVHRWCVTGTPINKSLQDLYGLYAFLDITPVSYEIWWDYLVKIPFYKKDRSLLFEFFGQTIWRTSKPSVLHQLGIPPQTEIFHWLHFSPVESHFYKRQYETCSSKIMARISRLKQTHGLDILVTRLSALDRNTLNSLLQPFLELRQACCHPHLVKGKVISLQKMKGTLTMEDLLTQLIKKTTIQCAEDHRLIVAALNGLAGLHIILDQWVEASEKYREVLQLADKYKAHFQTDPLPLLHALDNMADIIDRHWDGVPYTLRDDTLRSDAEDLRKKYLEKYSLALNKAREVVDPVSNNVMELMENFQCKRESWWFSVLRRASTLNKDDDLVGRIKDDFTYKAKMWKQKATGSLANKFNSISGLQHVMTEKILELENTRDSVLGSLEDLMKEDPTTFVLPAVNCHLRGQTQSYYNEDKHGYRCNLCSNHDQFLEYEAILFSLIENIKISRIGRNRQLHNFAGSAQEELTSEERAMILMKEEEELIETTEHINMNIIQDQRRQTWADSETEKVIKLLLNFAKLNGCSVPVIEDGTNHVKLFEAMKKEFRLLRILWRQLFDQVSAIDELSQATTRMRVRVGNEENTVKKHINKSQKALSSGISEKADKILTIHVLDRHEVEPRISQMKLDYATGKESLAIHMGQLLYLENLKKNGYGKKGTKNTDDCPICSNQLGHQWCVLICGHSFCSECIKLICTSNRGQSFQCPLCRQSMRMETVSYIDTTIPEEAGPSSGGPTRTIEIKGSHSTKVEAVVQTLLRLQETHPGEKVLIFSTWSDILDIISKALDQNEIKYCELSNSQKSKFHNIIDRFKNREDVQALLISLQSGSKGLNLIEATHVLLVEPILNISCELQAIGRVHRIGQTKPTYVHRFYVKNTIEEHLFEVLQSHDVSNDEEGYLTVADLQKIVNKGGGDS